MFVLLILIMFLDVQHPKLPADGIEKDFVATELDEQSLTGCAENPQGGGFNGDPLKVDWIKSPESIEPNVNSTRFSSDVTGMEDTAAHPMTMRVVPVEPPNPNPDPPTPPVATTPEPATFVILGITAATLLFLLFGRRFAERRYRRI